MRHKRTTELRYPHLWRHCLAAWSSAMNANSAVLLEYGRFKCNAVLAGVTNSFSGRYSSSLFGGTGTGAVAPNTPAMQSFPTGKMTISMWLHPTALSAGDRILSKRNDTLPGTPLECYVSDAGASRLQLTAGDFSGASSGTGFLINNELHHYAVVHNGSSLAFYRDGQFHSAGTSSVIAAAGTMASSVFIGRYVDGNPRFRGHILDIRWYRDAFTVADISLLSRSPLIPYQSKPRSIGQSLSNRRRRLLVGA